MRHSHYQFKFCHWNSNIRTFRCKAYTDDGRFTKSQIDALSHDEWDAQSEHLVILDAGRIQGCLRITFLSDAKQLPCFSTILPNASNGLLKIKSSASESSRMVISPTARHGHACPLLIKLAAQRILERADQWFIDAVDGPPGLKERSYVNIGFKETGIRYMDDIYQTKCCVLVAPDRRQIRNIARTLKTIVREPNYVPRSSQFQSVVSN